MTMFKKPLWALFCWYNISGIWLCLLSVLLLHCCCIDIVESRKSERLPKHLQLHQLGKQRSNSYALIDQFDKIMNNENTQSERKINNIRRIAGAGAGAGDGRQGSSSNNDQRQHAHRKKQQHKEPKENQRKRQRQRERQRERQRQRQPQRQPQRQRQHQRQRQRQRERQQQHNYQHHYQTNGDENISLWINDQQLKMLTALFFPRASSIGRMYAIKNGSVLYDILDGSAYRYLEYLILPPEVNYVNFTWKSAHRKYFYHFDRLETLNENILRTPTLSIKAKGRIPKQAKDFSVFLSCNGNNSGTAVVKVSLSIYNRKNVPLPGTPLRLTFKKGCASRSFYHKVDEGNLTHLTQAGPDPECHSKCGENGICNHRNICECRPGYSGKYCDTPVCFPQCRNGGNCTAPSVCTCPDGYQGIKCEGGMCTEKCLNGGKCIKKDKCECPRGYYGLRCEYSKCEISCMHGGRCIGTNLCKCAPGLSGDHCEIGQRQKPTCKDNCKFGHCTQHNKCECIEGYYGRFCNRRPKKIY